MRNEYNPATAYAFGNYYYFLLFYAFFVILNNVIRYKRNCVDRVFGPHANSQDVYDVAARPVVKAAMEGVNGMC